MRVNRESRLVDTEASLCSTTRVMGWRKALGKAPLGNPWNILELPGMLAGALELFRTSWKNLERPLFPPLGAVD